MDDTQKAQQLSKEIDKQISEAKQTQSLIDKLHEMLDKLNQKEKQS
jgi:hypothetical protein